MAALAEALATGVAVPHTELQVRNVMGRSTILHLTSTVIDSRAQGMVRGSGSMSPVDPVLVPVAPPQGPWI